ncbi:MAG: SRPBCC family protein [Planctomycetota bacterium]|nr:SRPBCC family protein [Planctomycetota bacterium]
MPNTIQLHRVFRCPASRLWRGLTDPRAMVKWSPPHGFVAEMHAHDFRVGGSYRMSFTNLGSSASHSFGGTYEEIVPEQKLRYSDQFENPGMPGAMGVTITLREIVGGTELNIVQSGVPDAIPAGFCYLGWQQSLDMLAALVEPEIP